MTKLTTLKNFPFQDAEVSLHVFKSYPRSDGSIKLTARWIQIASDLAMALSAVVRTTTDHVEELHEYSLLAQNHESSALSLSLAETYGGLILEGVDSPLPTKQVRRVKDLQNTDFYAIKLVSGDDVLIAVKKTDASWNVRRSQTAVTAYFSDQILRLDDSVRFKLARSVDFILLNDEVYVLEKRSFESVLRYRAAHEKDFGELQSDGEFQKLFTNLEPLNKFINQSRINLRRASAIRQKGHFRNPDFLRRLFLQHRDLRLNIVFDNTGRIVPSEDTCRDIMQALLDHRLTSPLSEAIFDVPSSTIVS